MRILFAGIIARYPFGGVTWCSLMYLLGLRALGHEVFYIEDTGECVYDPVQNTRATDPRDGTAYIHSALEPYGLGDRWSFVNYDGSYHGRSADDVRRYAADADLFINLSGGSWFWRNAYARRDRFTTVMTWQIESFADVGGNKDQEFVKFIELPSKTPQPFELAINGPQQLLRQYGWDTVDAMAVSRTPSAYREFILGSKAEFGVAKHTYVANRSGWFSDRTACYLASGRPALVQDTGWTAHLPSGDGLLAYSTLEEAAAGVDRINADYDRHARAAIDVAHAHFDARVV